MEIGVSETSTQLTKRGVEWFRIEDVILVLSVDIAESRRTYRQSAPPTGHRTMSFDEFRRTCRVQQNGRASWEIEGVCRDFVGMIVGKMTIHARERRGHGLDTVTIKRPVRTCLITLIIDL